MKRWIVIFSMMALILLIPQVSIAGSGTCGTNAYWTLNQGTLTISGSGAMYNYDSYQVSPWSALSEKVYTVKINNGITSIGNYSFSHLEDLQSISIPYSINTIGNYAFAGCLNLRTINIPSSVTSIGEGAFSFCQYIFSLAIPNSVKTIGKSAFESCLNLLTISLPNNITQIAESTFDGCWSLQTLSIPGSVTSIGKSAFASCRELRNITLPNGITTIPESAFFDCETLTSISIPSNVKAIGANAFCNCSKLKSFSVPQKVTIINEETFENCFALESIILPDRLVEIGEEAFANCGSLKELDFPNTITKIGKEAFTSCRSLKNIMLPTKLQTLEDYAFYMNALESVTMPDNLTQIGIQVFDPDYTEINKRCILYATIGSKTSIVLSKARYEFNPKGKGFSVIYTFNGEQTTGIELWSVDTQPFVLPDYITSFGPYIGSSTEFTASIGSAAAIVLSKADFEFYPTGENFKVIHTLKNGQISGVELCSIDTEPFALPEYITSFGQYIHRDDEFTASVGSNAALLLSKTGYEFYPTGKKFKIIYTFENGKSTGIELCSVDASPFTMPDYITSIGYGVRYNTLFYASIGSDEALLVSKENFKFRPIGTKLDLQYEFKNGEPSNLLLCSADSSITTLRIPHGVTEIDDYALSKCESITRIYMTSSIKDIGSNNFYRCSELKNVYVTIYDTYEDIDTSSYRNDYLVSASWHYNLENESFPLPGNLKVIDSESFASIRAENIVIPSTVKKINSKAFANCKKIKYIVINNPLISIAEDAFYGCSNFIVICKKGSMIDNWCKDHDIITLPK